MLSGKHGRPYLQREQGIALGSLMTKDGHPGAFAHFSTSGLEIAKTTPLVIQN